MEKQPFFRATNVFTQHDGNIEKPGDVEMEKARGELLVKKAIMKEGLKT